MAKADWRPEPVIIAIIWDEVWLEVICLTNSEIAGSPRNIFRYSGTILRCGGRALARFCNASCIVELNSEYRIVYVLVSPIRLSGAVLRETTQIDS